MRRFVRQVAQLARVAGVVEELGVALLPDHVLDELEAPVGNRPMQIW